ncbi:MAG TPA: hypothetical protein VIH87_02185 [Methylocella sp.]
MDEEDTMSRGKASGYTLTRSDAKIVLGMQAREDREHDIAAWFGVNQARVAEVKGGKFGTLEAAPVQELPPKGAPGIKGKRLRSAVDKALASLAKGDSGESAIILQKAVANYDADEA